MNEIESPLRSFGALVMADVALQARLLEICDPSQFAAAVAESAAARGLPIAADHVLHRLQADPAGLSRWMAPVAQGRAWPSRLWLPIELFAGDGGLCLDWAYFGTGGLREPFFAGSIRHALRRPINQVLRYRMALRDFLVHADLPESLPPSGFIFHMSRCGSTLTAQMLAALPQTIVVSEAAPIDASVQLSHSLPEQADEPYGRLLAVMMAAYGRRRAGDEQHYVVKLDSWHTLALPLFARAFPSVPWVFLYRDPVEVLVSQMRQPGAQMVPDIVPPSRYGIEDFDGVPDVEYHARVLEKICRAAVENVGLGRGLLINYRELPEAVFTKIMPHFGLACGESERDAMRLAAQRDAKSPSMAFSDDAEAKQREAGADLRATAERHIGPVYLDLEALRIGSGR